ncbi:MAG: 4-hydroxyacetophenone monooxygenase, partial [Acidimicrobiaceae bacterium]|nr:4-hydroxyacetophenone monooxygenase [Acidimicrobiaceae bacterium]
MDTMTEVAWTSSPFVGAIEEITASDDEIRAALEEAEIPPLLPALAYVTGDLSLLRPGLRPDPLLIGMPQGGLTEGQQAEARALAADALIRFRDAGSRPAPLPSDEDLLHLMEFAVGGRDMDDYLPLLEEELAFRGEDRRAPTWRKAETAPDADFRVAIIGAGMSGLLAAHRLQQAGVDFVVLEKNHEVGGTWLENSYPGCRVDNPNHNYSYSFAQRHDWPFHFSTQDVLLDYFQRCADVFGIRDHIRFGTEVRSATWSDEDERWTVVVRTADGVEESIGANAVISAVGQLNRPSFPTIEGRDSFEGPSFHSARWDHSVDLTGKRVAVIGTGASAVQFIPEIAPVV